MEILLKLIRVKFTGAEEQNKADLGGSKDHKAPIQQTQSFKEKKKAQNWFLRQFSRKMSRDYDSREMEHATAIAATAFAIYSQEASEILLQKKKSEPPEISLTKTKSKVDGTKSPISQRFGASISKRFSGSFKSKDDQGNKEPISTATKKPEKAITPAPSIKKKPTFSEPFKKIDDDKEPETSAPKRTSTFGDRNLQYTDDIQPVETPAQKVPSPVQPVPLRPPPPPAPPPIRQTSTVRPPNGTRRQTPTRPTPAEIKADAWERNELEKIKERYENLKETIDSWENRKKMKARRKLNNQQSEIAQKRMKAVEKYQSKIRYIEQIAGGARVQADERRRNEELKAKEKAKTIRLTGKIPGTCPCF